MTIEGILVGLLALAIGLAFCFYGFKLFLILLPIWGFFAGLVLGGSAITYIFGDGFLSTAFGIVVGLVVGLAFAVLAYLFYWAAIVLLGGGIGYYLAVGVLTWIGFNADGWITFLLALIVGALFAVAFIMAGMPAIIAIVATAIVGAATAVAGVVVGLGIEPLKSLNGGILGVYAKDELSWLWLVAAIALAVAGGWYQLREARDMRRAITADQYRNPGMSTPSGTAAA